MIEGKKWFCWRYEKPRELKVLLDDNGKLKYFADDGDGEFYNWEKSDMSNEEVVFDTEAEAMKYYNDNIAFFIQNAEKIKDFLGFLDDVGSYCKVPFELSDFVPEKVLHAKKASPDEILNETRLRDRLGNAIHGIINVAGITVHIDKIKYIKWPTKFQGCPNATLVLDDGEEIKVADFDDFLFLSQIFPKDKSSSMRM